MPCCCCNSRHMPVTCAPTTIQWWTAGQTCAVRLTNCNLRQPLKSVCSIGRTLRQVSTCPGLAEEDVEVAIAAGAHCTACIGGEVRTLASTYGSHKKIGMGKSIDPVLVAWLCREEEVQLNLCHCHYLCAGWNKDPFHGKVG
jgi:hypothetical protein